MSDAATNHSPTASHPADELESGKPPQVSDLLNALHESGIIPITGAFDLTDDYQCPLTAWGRRRGLRTHQEIFDHLGTVFCWGFVDGFDHGHKHTETPNHEYNLGFALGKEMRDICLSLYPDLEREHEQARL